MPFLLAGVAALAVLLFAARVFTHADPPKLAGVLRKAAGLILLALALFLLVRGAFPLAIPVGFFGLGLLGAPLGPWFGPGGPFGWGSTRKTPGQTSRARTESLEMELDHDSGRMEGMVLNGRFAGRWLSSLGVSDLLALDQELKMTDPQGMLLVEAYLDRRFPDWHAKAEEHTKEQSSAQAKGGMSKTEAYEVLGLEPGATKDEISAAHRRLMMKVHPDQGGSTYLAARINEAKDVLLGP